MTDTSVPASASPFRFTVQCHGPPTDGLGRRWPGKAEDLGYATLTVRRPPRRPARARSPPSSPPPTPPPRCGSASLVFCNDYRHPVVAGEGGRHARRALRRTPRARPRRRLEDRPTTSRRASPSTGPASASTGSPRRVDVVEGLWADGPSTCDGEHYRIDGPRRAAEAGAAPAPADPHRRWRPAGAHARRSARPTSSASTSTSRTGVIDATAGPTATAEATDEKVAWIREAAGDRFGDDRAPDPHPPGDGHRRPRRGRRGRRPALGLTPDAVARTAPTPSSAPSTQIVEQLRRSGASAGASRPSGSRPTPSSRWRPSSPAWPAPDSPSRTGASRLAGPTTGRVPSPDRSRGRPGRDVMTLTDLYCHVDIGASASRVWSVLSRPRPLPGVEPLDPQADGPAGHRATPASCGRRRPTGDAGRQPHRTSPPSRTPSSRRSGR